MAHFTLYGMWPSAPCYKVGLALRLMNLPFNYEHIDLMSGAQKEPDFLKLNPFGKVPLLIDHEMGDRIITESSLILQYLAERTLLYIGKDVDESLRIRAWQNWAVMALGFGIFRARAARMGFAQVTPDVLASYDRSAYQGLGEFDNLLVGGDFLSGNRPTIADVDLYSIVAYCDQAQINLNPYKTITQWMKRVENLPNFASNRDCLPMESESY